MMKGPFKPIIVWLGHKWRSEDELRNFKIWILTSESPLLNNLSFYDLSIEDGQKKGQNPLFWELRQHDRLAVFMIVVYETFGLDYVKGVIGETKKIVAENMHRVYPILFDDLIDLAGYKNNPIPNSINYLSEENNIDLFLPCFCRSRMTVVGVRRLVALLERIMGHDLNPDKGFPDYDWQTLLAIARHINREDFNFRSPKPRTIKKYKITEDGTIRIPPEFFQPVSQPLLKGF